MNTTTSFFVLFFIFHFCPDVMKTTHPNERIRRGSLKTQSLENSHPQHSEAGPASEINEFYKRYDIAIGYLVLGTIKGILNCFSSSLKPCIANALGNESKVHTNSSHPVKYPKFYLRIDTLHSNLIICSQSHHRKKPAHPVVLSA